MIEGRERDHREVVREMARDFADIARQLSSFKGDASAYLRDPKYAALRFRLEAAHAAVEAAAIEARRRVRLDEGGS